MGNGLIADAQITGTSMYTSWVLARLKLPNIQWCSKNPVNYADYVQAKSAWVLMIKHNKIKYQANLIVDFKEVITLTGVATQGDAVSPHYYVKKYYLEVSYDDIVYTDVADKCGTREVRLLLFP